MFSTFELLDITPQDFLETDEPAASDTDYLMNIDGDEYPIYFLNKIYGGAMIPRWANGKRNDALAAEGGQLSNECCKKSCSFPEMIGYCDGKGGFNSLHDV